MKPVRAAVFAYHDIGVRCLNVLLELGVEVPIVVTHEDDPAERVWFASVARLAASRGIDTITPAEPDAPQVIARVREAEPDFLFSFYYRRMLGPEILATSKRGAFNMHGSLLPKYRGRSPVNWAILKGEAETGVTLHEMVGKPDAGRIVDQEMVPIGPDDTALDVFGKITAAAEVVLRRALPVLVAGTAQLRAQDLARGSYFGGRRSEDGAIDWSRPAAEIHNLVRAVAPPFPGAFTVLAGKRIKILRTQLVSVFHTSRKSTGLRFDDGEWVAGCGDGNILRILEMEIEQ